MTDIKTWDATPREERILHLLCPVDANTDPDERRIPGACGHDCVGSQNTHDLLAQPGVHLVYCLPCFMREHD